jgi:beta-1,4-mannosyl-glycoprotein beta-1,4-N-acetylglucosaminyltransferase
MAIYDCFPFFNELELLEVRLHELAGVVDHFVLVESDRTHSNLPKPLHYEENKHLFREFHDKIIHVVVTDMPQDPNPWTREHHQRRCISRGLVNCKTDDIIMVSDMDEIPRGEKVKPYDRLHVFDQKCFYYFLNCYSGMWGGTRILPYHELLRLGDPQSVRFAGGPTIPDGGWHFSYLGGAERIKEKIRSYAHQELNTAKHVDDDYLKKVLNSGADIFNRNITWKFVEPTIEYLPKYVFDNKQKFHTMILEAIFNENWYSASQLDEITNLAKSVGHLQGAVLEIGCWEGKTTIALANSVYPDVVTAVETWKGNEDENPNHPTVHEARKRDIHKTFQNNVIVLTKGNVKDVVSHPTEFLKNFQEPVKFCHINFNHDYYSVKDSIERVKPLLVEGGVICGDNFTSAHAGRSDLHGGVERAVRELVPGFVFRNHIWHWVNTPV